MSYDLDDEPEKRKADRRRGSDDEPEKRSKLAARVFSSLLPSRGVVARTMCDGCYRKRGCRDVRDGATCRQRSPR